MPDAKKLVIWGAAGQAMVVADIVRARGDYDVAGFLDDLDPARHGTQFFGASVLGGAERLDDLKDIGVDTLIIGFGHSPARLRVAALVRDKGYQLGTAVHPRATVARDVRVGRGTVIKAGASVDPGVEIGENVIIGACASVGHHAVLDGGARVNGGAALAGYVRIGEAATIGTGARVRNGARIGAYSLIGIGAVVVTDIPERVVAYGVPARVRRPVRDEDY